LFDLAVFMSFGLDCTRIRCS